MIVNKENQQKHELNILFTDLYFRIFPNIIKFNILIFQTNYTFKYLNISTLF